MTVRTSRSVAGESGSLLAGAVANGLFAYVFIAIGTRSVGADGFAPVAVLWALWALSAAVLIFPVQHWVIRQMAVDGHGGGVSAFRGRLAAWVGGVTLVLTLVAVVFRVELFGSGSWTWPALVAATAAGSGYLGVLRGVLAGSGRYHAAAVVIGGENALRVVAAAAVSLAGGGPAAFGAALLAGPLIGLGWPTALRLGRQPGTSAPRGALLGFAGISLLLAQAVLNGGPPLLSALGGPEGQVTALFTALALFRAPNLLAQGLSVRITAPLTELIEDGARTRVRAIVGWGVSAIAGLAVLAALAAWWIGPAVIRALFGPGTDPSAVAAAGIAAGCIAALGNLGLTVALIARSAAAALPGSWLAGLAAGAVVLGAGGGIALPDRVVLAFLVAELTALAVMAGSMERWARAGQ